MMVSIIQWTTSLRYLVCLAAIKGYKQSISLSDWLLNPLRTLLWSSTHGWLLVTYLWLVT